MVTEPQTIRDVWYMVETSSCCHLYYQSLCSFDEMEVGCRTERYTDVETNYYCHTIHIVTYESECKNINRDKRSYSTQGIIVDTQTYHNMVEFRDSVFWEDFLKKFKDGNPDSSWFDDVGIRHNEHDGDIQIDCEFGEPQWDWLNRRYRTAKYHHPLSLMIDTHYGTIDIESEDKHFTFTLKELMDIMDTLKLLEDHNIKIDKYNGIKIPWMEQE